MDIYALGATIYNMLTKTPVNSKKLIELMNATTANPGSGKIASDLKSAWNSFNPDFERVAKVAQAVPAFEKKLDKYARHLPLTWCHAAWLLEMSVAELNLTI